MLIRLHNQLAVNPQNVAAMFLYGEMVITFRMITGRSHNLQCGDKKECSLKFGKILSSMKSHDDFYRVDAGRAINVNHIISLATTGAGVVINMTGDFSVYLPTTEKAEMIERLSKELEAFG